MNHPLLGVKNPSKGSDSHAWQLDFNTRSLHYLKDHALKGIAIVPGAAYVEVGLAGIITILGNVPYKLSNISFDQVLLLSDNVPHFARLEITRDTDTIWKSRVTSGSEENQAEENAQTHAHLTFEVDYEQQPPDTSSSIDEISARCPEEYAGPAIYERFQSNGNEYGPSFQNIANLYLGTNECLASLRLHSHVEAEMYHYHVHPSIFDACIQSLASADFHNANTYVLSHIEELCLYQFPSKVGWVHATITDAVSPGMLKGTIQLFDTSQELVLEMSGVHLKYLVEEDKPTKEPEEKNQIVVASTFTAEPVEATLSYWMDAFKTPTNISFAPYNQIFQELLNAQSLLASNVDGLNVLLVRFSDWSYNTSSLPKHVEEHKKARLLSQRDHYTLPNQLKIAHLNEYETEYLYKEIFLDQTYLKHGIEINEDACVIDVGANIGMFTMFVLHNAPNATIYCFEPSPPAYEALALNASLYGKNVVPFNIGLSDKDGEAQFTFYSNSSVFSSFHADQDLDKAAIQTVVENALVQTELDQHSVDVFTEELMEDRLQKQTFPCELKALSTIIDEENIETIDLLKVDVEKSELHVLRGIRDEHWPRIKQIVIEVHDTIGDTIKEVTRILAVHGFEVAIEEEELLKESGLYNLYGRRTDHSESSPSKALNQARTALERNIKDFTEGLLVRQQINNVPCIVVTCPENPEVYSDEDQKAVYDFAEETLSDKLQSIPNTFLISHREIQRFYPVETYFDVKGQAIGDVPYTPRYFSSIGTSVARKIQSISRKPYKVIILDCDNTLWDGVVGDAGPLGVQITDAHKALQSFMIKQHNAGLLLCLASKNAEADVLAVFDQNDNMLLKRDHIVTTRINWIEKSKNIRSIAEELDLGLDSFIFIDDNPVECAEVQAHCPEVLTLQLPSDSAEIESFLNHVWAFDHLKITAEDRKRTLLYQQNIRRTEYKNSALSFASFIEGLQLQIQIAAPQPSQLPRVAQLTQRTNQFNMSTIRRSEAEVSAWLNEEDTFAFCVSVKDRFGDYGLVGTLLYSMLDGILHVDSFILSCRVLGKGVEHAMLQKLGEVAKEHDCKEVQIPYIQTQKNLPALRFLLQANQASQEDTAIPEHIFVFPTEQALATSFNPESFNPPAKEETQRAKKTTHNDYTSLAPLERIAHEFKTAKDILQAVRTHSLRARPNQPASFIAPGKKMEQSIASIWKDVLGIEQIGINDNFFEIGGTSLKAVQVISQIRSQIGADISLVTMFEKPNIQALASLLDGSESKEASSQSASRQRGEKRRAQRARRGRQRKS